MSARTQNFQNTNLVPVESSSRRRRGTAKHAQVTESSEVIELRRPPQADDVEPPDTGSRDPISASPGSTAASRSDMLFYQFVVPIYHVMYGLDNLFLKECQTAFGTWDDHQILGDASKRMKPIGQNGLGNFTDHANKNYSRRKVLVHYSSIEDDFVLSPRYRLWIAALDYRFNFLDRDRTLSERDGHDLFISKAKKLANRIPKLMTAALLPMENEKSWPVASESIRQFLQLLEYRLKEIVRARNAADSKAAASRTSKTAIAYPGSNSGMPAMTAAVRATRLTCTVLVYLAWSRSTDARGSTKDPDFWLLLQSSIMQLLSLFTTLYPAWLKSWMPRHSWVWAWTYAAISCMCSIAATPFYVVFPVQWSSAVSFGGSVSQALVILQLVQAIDKR